MADVTVEFRVSVTLTIDDEIAPKVTHDDIVEMAHNAVSCGHSNCGVQVIAENGKAQWRVPYRPDGEMKPEEAEFADVFVEDASFGEVEIETSDDEFKAIREGR